MKKTLWLLPLLFLGTVLFAVEVKVPEKTQVVTIHFTASKTAPVKMTFFWKDGTKQNLTVKAADSSYRVNSNSGERIKMPDAGYLFSEFKVLDYVRGNIALLKRKSRRELEKTYAQRPPLPAKKYTLKVVNQENSAQFFVNGNLAYHLPYKRKKPTSFTKILTTLPAKNFSFSAEKPCQKYHTLPVAARNQPGSFKGAKITYKDDKKIPFGKITSANLDLGATSLQYSLYPNDYGDSGQTGRNAFDNAENSFLFSVPMVQYSHVWLLCAADTNPSKDPSLTARLTRYVPSGHMGGRAYSAIADTRVKFPVGNAQEVGKVTIGKKVLPLWRVRVPLDMGKVVDLVTHPFNTYGRGAFRFHYLDFELMGITPLYRTPFGDPRVWPSPSKVSSVHVFGAVLERAKVDVKFLQTTPSKNMFDDTMTPAMKVEYKKVFPGKYALEWEISDHTGKVLKKEKTALEGDSGVKNIDLSMPKLGWYKVVYTVKDAANNDFILRHDAPFALMGKDTRRALWDSPYIGWSRGSYHYGNGDSEEEGLRARMLGIRRMTSLASTYRKVVNKKRVPMVEKDWEKYKLTSLVVYSFTQGQLKRFEKMGEAKLVETIREVLKKYPNAIQVPLFWENTAPFGPYAQAPEIYGFKPAPYNEARKKNATQRWEMIQWAQKIIRKHFPQLKIMYGNSLACSELIAEALRQKPSKNFADYWGTEAIQRTAHPEKPFIPFTMMTANEMNRTGELFGYGHIRTATGPENIARKADTIGLHRHAEWYVRDMLVQHIFKFDFIAGAGTGGGVGNSYDASFYAGGPARAPYCYPNPSASATGTLTKVLDQVEFKRMFPTTSNTVYCAEFLRKYDKKIIYVLWTSRGEADLAIKTTSSNVEHVEFHGHSSTPSIWFNNYKLTASTAAQYVLTDKPFASVKITGRRIAHEKDADPKEFTVIDKVDSAVKWKVDMKNVPAVEGKYKPGLNRYLAKEATAKEMKDAQKGSCLQLSIKTDRKLNDFFSEYMVIRPDKPIPIKDEVDSIGLWVKGNSGWGQIYFELEDANGIRRVSSGTFVHGGKSCLADFEGRLSIDYDGAWAFLAVPVTGNSPIRELSTGSVKNIWSGPWSTPKMPCKLTGIYFCAPVKPFFHNTPKYVDQTILIKDVSARTKKPVAVPAGSYARKLLVAGSRSAYGRLRNLVMAKDWGIEFSASTKSKQKNWYDNGTEFPHFETLNENGIDAVFVPEYAITKKTLPMIKPYVENGGIAIFGYTIFGQTAERDRKLAQALFGMKKPKALHEIPYTQKKSLEHEVKYLPAFGKKRQWKYKTVYAPFALETAGAVPLVEHCEKKGYFLATIHQIGNGYVIFCGSNDQQLVMDLLEFAFSKPDLKKLSAK